MTDGLFGTGIAAPQLRQTALQPAGIPGSTFVRPAQKQVGGNLQALASALGNLNSALGSFAAKRQQEETDPNSDFNREWIAKRQQMTAEQLREEVKNNTAGGNLVRRDTIDVLLAERTNDAFRTKWTEFYNTDYDKTKGQFETEYERMRQEYATLLPTEVAKGRFYQLTDTYKAQWAQEDQKQKIGLAQEYLGSAALSSFRTAIEDGRNVDGKSPDQIAQSVFRMSASNRDFAGMDGAQQNALLYQLAQEYALKGDVEIVRALLKGQRVGSDGKPLPALMETKSFTTDAIKLLQTAQEERSRVVKENGLKSFIEIDNLVRDGKFTLAEAEKWKGTGLLTDAQLSDNVNASENNRLQALASYAKEEAKLQARRASETQEAQVIGQALSASFKFGGMASIKDELEQELRDTTVTINGMMIPDDRDLPEDFPMLAQAELADAFNAWGAAYGLEKPEDLAIIPVSGQSKWQIIVKATGVPLKSTAITPHVLDARRSKLNRERDLRVLELVKAKDAEKAEKQAIYDADIQGLKDLIARYSRPTTGVLGKQFGKYLQGVLDDRLARDKKFMGMTEEQINAELDRIQKEQDTPPPAGSWGAFDPAAW